MAAGQTAIADPISDVMVSPQASLAARRFLQNVLRNTAGAPSDLVAVVQALLANVLMNDVLNWWNGAGQPELNEASVAADEAIRLNGNLALGYHARGLVRREDGDPQGASGDFAQALTLDQSFARAHAQQGNQKALQGQPQNSHGDFANARAHGAGHRATGYFDWGEGRAFFEQAAQSNAPADWRNAIACLTRSVRDLPTVWYNRCYLAAAQNGNGDNNSARQTITDFVNDPRFDQATFTRIKQLQPDPNHPARQRMLAFVQPLLRQLLP
jgi:hypothetical protein